MLDSFRFTPETAKGRPRPPWDLPFGAGAGWKVFFAQFVKGMVSELDLLGAVVGSHHGSPVRP